MPATVKASELLSQAVETLKASPNIDHWQKGREQIEAEDLLAFVWSGEDAVEPEPDDELTPAQVRRFRRAIERRATGEPVAFIKGYAEFKGLRLIARPGVFVPRDSTEYLADLAVKRLHGRRAPVAVDLATGGGTIALAMKDGVRRARVFGTDISRRAVAIARHNAERLRLGATFATGDLFGGLPERIKGRVDVITLHPPYVAKDELVDLPHEIKAYEPVHTLTDHSANGLGLVERAAAEGMEWLRPGGWLLVEVSPDRARGVAAIFRRAGLHDVRSRKDPTWNITRVIVGRK